MTFEQWLDARPPKELYLSAKDLEAYILRIAKAAWEAGHAQGMVDADQRCEPQTP